MKRNQKNYRELSQWYQLLKNQLLSSPHITLRWSKSKIVCHFWIHQAQEFCRVAEISRQPLWWQQKWSLKISYLSNQLKTLFKIRLYAQNNHLHQFYCKKTIGATRLKCNRVVFWIDSKIEIWLSKHHKPKQVVLRAWQPHLQNRSQMTKSIY